MIGRLHGVIVEKQPPHLLLEVGGVGYELEAPMTTFYDLPETGSTVTLFTHLVVREDAHLLFAFGSERERRLFRTLLKVNGVGARLALAILSGMDAEDFARVVHDNDASALTRLPGVGKKTAERLIMEMRDRLKDWQPATASAGSPAGGTSDDTSNDAISALIALGYKPQEASKYVYAVAEPGMSSEALIKAALKASVK
ncbi:Holliday junction DNA helicase RuvA [Methylohalomonas lacus]|uniref:Holliday junction branch migration complex subunit RuvA n=1 Tax=Methylohalomonas lacus TaxID=398773 RepID=A0AAE3HP07_9GAMM|nr:Holliday junction branch migration protein RuvA [Methylohalomonas lacus]MCS3904183.1 Holliday junction DNA helicase RuvA [Methylohalomonas lacus]